MTTTSLFDRAQEVASVIRPALPSVPSVGVILGSGLDLFAERLADRLTLPCSSLPHFPLPTVAGHAGNLVVGRCGMVRLAVFQGRFHHYEGHELEVATFPVRVLQALGVPTLILTAAVGGITSGLKAGSLVAISDHLNLLGANPLRGPNDDRLGVRFLDLSAVYSPRLRALAIEEARRLGFKLPSGVYACMPGPCYETPAEVRMLRTLGADVVGMSTVPEAIVARHAGMEVLALAVVANRAAGLSQTPLDHAEVLHAGRQASPRLADLLQAVCARIGEDVDDR